jgi:AcrR family transcriptional regulator
MQTATDPRTRILDAALRLMSEQGSSGASMRQLAAASGLNVATLYHYFPSKADLLGSLLEQRQYGSRLFAETPPVHTDAPARDRIVALIRWFWEGALEEESVWRLLIGEALHGEERATTSAQELVESIDSALTAWLGDLVPELPVEPAVGARIVRAQLFSLVVEHLAVRPVAPADAEGRADELAALLLPA